MNKMYNGDFKHCNNIIYEKNTWRNGTLYSMNYTFNSVYAYIYKILIVKTITETFISHRTCWN